MSFGSHFSITLPSLLPLDIIWLLRPKEGFSGPEIFFEVFLADVDAELVFRPHRRKKLGIRSCRPGDSWKMDESIHEPEFPEIKVIIKLR